MTEHDANGEGLQSIDPLLPAPPLIQGSGLSATLAHVVSAVITDGRLQRATLAGELCLSYPSTEPASVAVRVGNLDVYDAAAPTEKYAPLMRTVDSKQGLYELDTKYLHKHAPGGTATGVAFRFTHGAATAFVPVLVSARWRVSRTVSELVVTTAVTPAYAHRAAELRLSDVVVSVPVAGGSADKTTPQATPPAQYARAARTLRWTVPGPTAPGDLVLQCRFVTDADADAPPVFEDPRGIEVAFAVDLVGPKHGDALHDHDIPLSYSTGSTGDWEPVRPAVRISTGKYRVHTVDHVEYT